MAKLQLSRQYPLPFLLDFHARNGRMPQGGTIRKAAAAHVWALTHCRKLLFTGAVDPELQPIAGSGETSLMWFQFRTGEANNAAGTVDIRVSCTVTPAGNAAATDPRWRVRVSDTALSSVADSDYQRFASVDTSPDASAFATQEARVTGLSPNTHYVAEIAGTDYIGIISASGWEHVPSRPDTAATYVTDFRGLGNRTKVFDADATAIRTNCQAIWEAGGPILCNVTRDDNAYSTTSASYVNMLDAGASTTVGANTAGFNLAVQYHNTRETTNVPCKVAVVGRTATGTGGDLIIKDSSGTLATVSSFTTSNSVKTATFNLDASAATHKVDIQFRISGAATQLFVENVAIWEDD
jgi:hypothetical protein